MGWSLDDWKAASPNLNLRVSLNFKFFKPDNCFKFKIYAWLSTIAYLYCLLIVMDAFDHSLRSPLDAGGGRRVGNRTDIVARTAESSCCRKLAAIAAAAPEASVCMFTMRGRDDEVAYG